MTCNQLMVLLDVRRGTFRESRHMGTVARDLLYLLRRGLVTDCTSPVFGDKQSVAITDDGEALVARVLGTTEE